MIGLVLALAFPAVSDEANKALRSAPKDIGAYVERRAECDHWAGEPGWDKAREAQINQALRDLKCDRLDATERVLRKKYAKRRDWVKLLTVE